MSADYYSIDPMKETEQTLLDKIKDDVAIFLYNASWNSIGPLRRAHCWPQVHSKHVEHLELIIHGITEGAEEWKSKCADLERDKAKMFTRSQVQASCEATLKMTAKAVTKKHGIGYEKSILDKSNITIV